MSISGLSGASIVGSALPASPGLGAGVVSDQPQTAAEKAKAKADAAAAQQASMLADIRKKGIYAWAQEQKLEALKAKIRAQVLADRKMDENSLKSMNPEDRASAETSIEEEIARRIKEAMQANLEGQAKDAAAQGQAPQAADHRHLGLRPGHPPPARCQARRNTLLWPSWSRRGAPRGTGAPEMVVVALLVPLVLVSLGFGVMLVRACLAAGALRPRPEALAMSAVANFFDTLGISSFATTLAWMRVRRLVPDRLIPPTLVAGYTLPTLLQSGVFLALLGVRVDPVLLAGCIVAMVAGGLVGAHLVTRTPVRIVQAIVGIALLLAAAFFTLANLKLMPVGGTATGLPPGLMAVTIAAHFVLGILINFGVGNYAPTLAMLSLFGMDPRLAFPIMASSAAFCIAGASVRLVRHEAELDLRGGAGHGGRRDPGGADRGVRGARDAAGAAALAGRGGDHLRRDHPAARRLGRGPRRRSRRSKPTSPRPEAGRSRHFAGNASSAASLSASSLSAWP